MRNAYRLVACLLFVWSVGVAEAAQWWWNGQATINNAGTNAVSYRYWYLSSDSGTWTTGSDAQAQVSESITVNISNSVVGTTQPGCGPSITIRIRVGTYGSAPANNSTERDAAQHVYVFDGCGLVETTQNSYTPNPLPAPYNGGPDNCPILATLYNTSLMIKRGYWVLNGDVIHSEDIPPGSSRTHLIEPPDCDDFTASAYTVDLFLNEDFELLPQTNIWFEGDSTTIPNGITNTLETPFFPSQPMIGTNITDNNNPQAPVHWSPGSATNPATAIQEGSAAGIISQQQFDAMTHALLNAIRTNTQNTAEGQAAVVGAVTNLLNAATNRISEEDLADFIAAQEDMSLAEAAALGAELEAALDAMEPPGATGGSPLDETIAISSGPFSYTMDLSLDGWGPSASIMSAMKAGFTWLIILVLFAKQFTLVWQAAINLMQVPQGTTAGTSVVGTNVNATSAVIMAGIICGVIVAAPVLLAAQWDRSWEATNPVNTMSSISNVMGHGAYYAAQIFPIGVLLTALASYFTFRFFALSTTIVQALIIRLLVGL